MSEGDFSDLVTVHHTAWHATYDLILDHEYCLKNTPERLERYWRKFFDKQKQDDRFVVVATDGDEIVGFLAAGPLKYLSEEASAFPFKQSCAEIYKFYVLPAKQGTGLGKQLMRQCFERLLAEKYKEVIVRVFESNKNACAFYERYGGQLLQKEPFVYNPLLPYKIYRYVL